MNQNRRRRVLFLCTHNSSRSIMAEAIVNHFLSDLWEAYSAGTDPRGVNLLTLKALHEIGIEIPKAESKHLKMFLGQQFDCVMTLCDEANESCPFWPEATRREHISFPDPSLARGSEADKLEVFRDVRNKIKEIIIPKLLE
jgi:arsenate reductase (thioredoxin)